MSLADLKAEAQEACRFVLISQDDVYGIAPGRVEVLGNHTDYNDGLVLSAAIDRYVVAAGRRTGGQAAGVYADAYERLHQFNTQEMQRDGTAPWCDYIMGVVAELQKAGHPVAGFEAAVVGDVPLGAGLSSSAALEVALARFLIGAYELSIPDKELALLCQRAENDFVGMNCGILDQWSSIHGKADSLIFLDCRELTGESVPLGPEVTLVLADTKAAHELVDGTYNSLRESCFRAAKKLAAHKPEATHLRDVTPEELEAWGAELDEEERARAHHVVHENRRVRDGVQALQSGDVETLGRLMLESHESSRDRFGNSCAELDAMVALAREIDGCYGCRLSGGGFGGCTVNLVAAGAAESFAAELARQYEAATGIAPATHICRAVDGARTETA